MMTRCDDKIYDDDMMIRYDEEEEDTMKMSMLWVTQFVLCRSVNAAHWLASGQ